MTDATTSTPAPKKSYTKYVVIIVIAVGVWFDYSKTHILFGKDATSSDSTSVVVSAPALPADSIKAVASIDTVKADTTKKK